MAVNRRVYAGAEPAGSCEIEGSIGNRSLYWERGRPGNPLLDAAYETAQRLCRHHGFDCRILRKKISIDSRQLFFPDGRKRGFGSSAAVVLSVLALLLGDSGLSADELQKLLMREAVRAHRAAQNGKGSGYDICTSLQGGIGLFTGGVRVKREVMQHGALRMLRFYLSSGKTEILTGTAVSRYEEWKREHPEKADRFRRDSAVLAGRLAQTGDPAACLSILKKAAELGEFLGRQIGVDATPPPRDYGCGTCAVKCVGAGNETVLRACLQETQAGASEEEIEIDEDGLVWE
jgi:mevalonate kinase